LVEIQDSDLGVRNLSETYHSLVLHLHLTKSHRFHQFVALKDTKTYSSLSLADFGKRFTIQELSKEGLKNISPTVICLAAAEGLTAHERAVTIRMEKLAK
jgi:excinuclease UvrABC nuclease subunit